MEFHIVKHALIVHRIKMRLKKKRCRCDLIGFYSCFRISFYNVSNAVWFSWITLPAKYSMAREKNASTQFVVNKHLRSSKWIHLNLQEKSIYCTFQFISIYDGIEFSFESISKSNFFTQMWLFFYWNEWCTIFGMRMLE